LQSRDAPVALAERLLDTVLVVLTLFEVPGVQDYSAEGTALRLLESAFLELDSTSEDAPIPADAEPPPSVIAHLPRIRAAILKRLRPVPASPSLDALLDPEAVGERSRLLPVRSLASACGGVH